MNQFEIATKELVSTEVSQFFGVVQGKWNRHMEIAALHLINEQIQQCTSSNKELFIDNAKFFQNSHEKFACKSLLDTLSFLKNLKLDLFIQDGELRFNTSGLSEDGVLDNIEELLNFISPY